MATRAGIKAAVQAALAACAAAASIPVSALGLGDIRIQSFLNEPLRAEVELLDTRELLVDDIRIRLAGSEDFDRLGVERSYFLTGIQFEVRIDAATGQGVILLSTEDAVLEPYLDFIIEARWPSGRLLREYTVLVDPPAFHQDMVTVSVAERVEAMTSKPPAGEPAPSTQRTRESSSGDSVRLRESTLPPGEMPERAFSAETSSTPAAGKRYMVRRDETLWEIAAQARPQGITVQQAMLDIQRLNPEAFIDGNINLIKAGYIIYLPAAGEVNSDDLATALDEVRSQNEQWRARRIPGVTAAATLRVSAAPPPEGARGASGADESSMPAPRSQDTAEDTAVPAAADRDGDGDGPEATQSSAQAQGSAAQESAAQDPAPPAGASAASAQLLAQLNAMSERLDTVEQIIAVKDEQIATLQQALREAREAAAAAAAAQRAAPVAQQVAMRPASGGIPWLPIAGGGLLILLVSIALLLRRRARSPAGAAAAAVGRARGDDVFTGVSLNKDALDGVEEPEQPEADEHAATVLTEPRDAEEAEPADVDEILDPGGSRGYGERRNDDYIDDAAAGDALAEADIYIAYGRYLQAVELLTEAVNNEPANSAYRTKLIELYVDMGERQNAAEQLDELRAHGDADAIARAEEALGGMADADVEGDDAEPLHFSGPSGADEQLADADSAAPEAVATVPEAAEQAASFEADLPGDDASVSEPAADEPEATPVSLEPQDPLEFSLEDLGAAKPAESPGSAVSQAPASESEATKDTQTLEFDELDIVVDSAEPAPGEESFDLEDELTPAAHSDVSAQESAAEEDEVLIADDSDQMATKLDLARAYLDMGDGESARGMLEEVAANGSDQQRQEAQELLSRMD